MIIYGKKVGAECRYQLGDVIRLICTNGVVYTPVSTNSVVRSIHHGDDQNQVLRQPHN